MTKLSPNAQITGTNHTIIDFWTWAYSDILSNRNRGIFAEFLVGSALNVLNEPRVEWDGHDLIYSNQKIEVKSSAYLQSWYQSELSSIRFDIAPKKSWDAQTNTYQQVIDRYSNCYVFCLFKSSDKATANILDVTQWEFYIVTTQTLNEKLPQQKSIGLKSLQSLSEKVNYHQIRLTIDRLLDL